MTTEKTAVKVAQTAVKPTFYDRVATLADMILQHPKNEQERQEAAQVKKMMSRKLRSV